MKNSIIQEQAEKFVTACHEKGFSVVVKSELVIAIMRRFTPGDEKVFVECDMEGGSLLAMVPLRGGSVWGTDGGSIGGAVAIYNGHYCLNKSGSGKRFIDAVRRRLQEGPVSK